MDTKEIKNNKNQNYFHTKIDNPIKQVADAFEQIVHFLLNLS